MKRKTRELPEMPPEARKECDELRAKGNALWAKGDQSGATRLFNQARYIEDEHREADKWDTRLRFKEDRYFSAPLTDKINNIGITRITLGGLELLKNGTLTHVIRGVRVAIRFLDEADERIPARYRKKPLNETNVSAEAIDPSAPQRSFRALKKRIRDLHEAFINRDLVQKLSGKAPDMTAPDLSVTFFDKVNLNDYSDSNLGGKFNFNLDSTPDRMSRDEPCAIDDLFDASGPDSANAHTIIGAIRAHMGNAGARIVGRVLSGEWRSRK